MSEKIYSHLSEIYNHLMKFIDYKMWSDYIFTISKELNKKNINALELASGSCNIASYLQKKYDFFVASDISMNMLQNSKSKIKNKVCCTFYNLPFKNKFDLIFSTFDSINYINTQEKFIKMLNEVNSVLYDDGIFTFDASMENNSLKYQIYLNRKGTYKGISFQQISRYNKKLRIHQNKFIFETKNGFKYEEIHNQKIYKFDDYFKMIDNSNFYVSSCYDAFTFNNANENSERVQFILKKRN